MSIRHVSRRAAGALGVLVITTGIAHAGAFALREQSAYGQGASFAGIAAGGALSSMFWNPATITQFRGFTSETVMTGVLPHASHSFTTAIPDAAFGTAGNSGINALVPAGYTSYQVNDRLWVALSTNAPFGLGVHFPQVWAGGRGGSGESAKITTYNFAPTVAYKFNDMFSVAVGLQAQYMKASYDALLSPAGPLLATLNGGSWNYGWTAGLTVTPLKGTEIGVGYRSSIDQKLSGTWAVPAPFSALTQPGSVNLNLPLPATLTVGLRQAIGDRFTLLAGFEWANWSRIGTALLMQPNGAQVTLGGAPVTFPFQYRDGYFYSLGGEYIWDPAWTFRAGIAFERSPISDGVRTVRIPDNDRMWYSVGATWKPSFFRNVLLDVGYSFVDVKNASICMGPAALGGCPSNPWSGATSYVGSVSAYVNIISFGLRYQFGAEPAPARVVTKG
jgi:long-chain fatty acid transport protein